jgi:hypothetical protein
MRKGKAFDNLEHYCAYNGIVGENKEELFSIFDQVFERKLKPIKDTKFGEWLKQHAPELLEMVGDLLPEKGIWKIIKALIDKLDLDNESKSKAGVLFEEVAR